MPRLVVIMPAFNAATTIYRAASTTLRAMPTDSELIVLDDKSTDNTLAAVDAINDRRLRILTSGENLGSGRARQRMLAESDSEFVAAMDADDVTFPWRFSRQLPAMASFDVTFGAVVRFARADAGGLHEPVQPFSLIRPSAPIALNPDEFSSALLFHCAVWQSTMTAKRSALENAGGYRPLRYGQDWDMFLRLAFHGATMYRSALPLIGYRASALQVTRRPDYVRICKSQPLRDSYVQLFNSRNRSAPIEVERQNGSELEATIKAGLTEQLGAFHPINRLRYARLLRSGRLLGAVGLFQ